MSLPFVSRQKQLLFELILLSHRLVKCFDSLVDKALRPPEGQRLGRLLLLLPLAHLLKDLVLEALCLRLAFNELSFLLRRGEQFLSLFHGKGVHTDLNLVELDFFIANATELHQSEDAQVGEQGTTSQEHEHERLENGVFVRGISDKHCKANLAALLTAALL